MCFGFIFLLLGSVGDFVVPFYVGKVITALGEGNFDAVSTYCLHLFLIVCCSGACAGCRAYIFNLLSEMISRDLRRDFFESIINKDVAFYDERRTGDLLSRINSDTQVVQDCLSTSVSMFIRSLVFIICTLVVLCLYSATLTGITMCGIIPIMAFGGVYGLKMKKLTKEMQDNKAKMSAVAEESFGNIRTVKAFANEVEETDKFNTNNLAVYDIAKYRCIWQGFFVFMIQVLLYGSMSAIIYFAGKQYENGKIDIGTITSFLFYMILLMFNFGILGAVFGNVMSIFGASDKIVMMMQYETDLNTQGGIKLPENRDDSNIELRNVKFQYPSKTDVHVLKGVNITVDNNKKRVVALVGQSGCGKSSIISMIERFYDAVEGGVYFNGTNIKDLEPRWYHEQISLVQQEPVLFSGTIQENILYGLKTEHL
jgi:ATP-binding cassette subfamily B protein